MAIWNLGSVGSAVLIRTPETPDYISGTPLMNMADQERIFMEDYTGINIGSVDIDEKYQGALTDLTRSSVLELLEAENASTDSLHLGDFNTKSASSSKSSTSIAVRAIGMRKLEMIGKKLNFFKVNG